jgi:hypothetical protein
LCSCSFLKNDCFNFCPICGAKIKYIEDKPILGYKVFEDRITGKNYFEYIIKRCIRNWEILFIDFLWEDKRKYYIELKNYNDFDNFKKDMIELDLWNKNKFYEYTYTVFKEETDIVIM